MRKLAYETLQLTKCRFIFDEKRCVTGAETNQLRAKLTTLTLFSNEYLKIIKFLHVRNKNR